MSRMPSLEALFSEELSQHVHKLTFPPTAHRASGSSQLLASFCFLLACLFSNSHLSVCAVGPHSPLCVSELPHIRGYSSVISATVIKYPNKKQLHGEGGSFQFTVLGYSMPLWGKSR